MNIIEDKLKLLPDSPGVYVMLNADAEIIYVGKAKNLKNRVRQYFRGKTKPIKVASMVSNVSDFYYYVALSEIDALSLEDTLIKKHKPRYNILLKDDKTYPYIKVNLKEDFPSFTVTRKLKKDGCKYFGPYMAGVNVFDTLEMINVVFGVRPCDKKILQDKKTKVCLNYHINKCNGVCAGLVDKKEYGSRVKQAIDFLNGNTNLAESILRQKMQACAGLEQFELALKYRNLISELDKIKVKRLTSLNRYICADVISVENNGLYSAVHVLIVRNGKTIGGKNFSFDSLTDEKELVSEFIMQYYNSSSDFPEEIITSLEIEDKPLLEEYFKKKFGENIVITCAKKGVKKSLSNMSTANAKEHLETAINRIKHKNDMTIMACKRLQEILSLSSYPKRMECYDISNISGTDKVGSMVVFIDGEPSKSQYRRFKIKTVQGADDYKSHQEVMARRLERLLAKDQNFSKPNLIIIDGGKGQLSSVKEIFDLKGIKDIDLIALAEKNEEIYTLYKSEPIVLGKDDYVLKLLIRIRDEAHRFAITYHRSLRDKRAFSSVLTGIKGLGKTKINALLDRFKDIGGIVLASKKELESVEGIGENFADKIIQKLTEEGLRWNTIYLWQTLTARLVVPQT